VQITVVATGFDAEKVRETPVEKLSRISREDFNKKEEEKIENPRITFPSRKVETKMIVEEKVSPRMTTPIREEKSLEEDDELEIPAFIRRKMGK
jgi:hypothetical protein